MWLELSGPVSRTATDRIQDGSLKSDQGSRTIPNALVFGSTAVMAVTAALPSSAVGLTLATATGRIGTQKS